MSNLSIYSVRVLKVIGCLCFFMSWNNTFSLPMLGLSLFILRLLFWLSDNDAEWVYIGVSWKSNLWNLIHVGIRRQGPLTKHRYLTRWEWQWVDWKHHPISIPQKQTIRVACQAAENVGVTKCHIRRWWAKKVLIVKQNLSVVPEPTSSKTLTDEYASMWLKKQI